MDTAYDDEVPRPWKCDALAACILNDGGLICDRETCIKQGQRVVWSGTAIPRWSTIGHAMVADEAELVSLNRATIVCDWVLAPWEMSGNGSRLHYCVANGQTTFKFKGSVDYMLYATPKYLLIGLPILITLIAVGATFAFRGSKERRYQRRVVSAAQQ